MDDRELERLLRATLQKLSVSIRVEQLEEGIGGYCRLGSERLVVLSSSSSRKQRIQVLLNALKQLDTSGVFLPPSVRDLIEEPESF